MFGQAVLTDLAVTADALATATADFVSLADRPARKAVLARAGELAASARRLELDASRARHGGSATVPAVPAAREVRRVQIIRQRSDIADALGNLARLIPSGRPRAAELFATATMLAAMADTLAGELGTAARAPRMRDSASLRVAATTLTAYRRELTRAVREHQPELASLGHGNAAALARARRSARPGCRG